MNKRLLGSALLASGLILSGCGQAPQQATETSPTAQTKATADLTLLP